MVGRSSFLSTIDCRTASRPSTSIWSIFTVRRSFESGWMKIIPVHVHIIQGHVLSCWTLCLVEATAVRGIVPSVSHTLQHWGVLYRLWFICLQWSYGRLVFFFGCGCRLCVVIITVGDVLVVVVTYSCNQLFSHVFGIDTVVMLHGCEPDVMSVWWAHSKMAYGAVQSVFKDWCCGRWGCM